MLGQLLVDTDRRLDAVPHWHAVLKHVREAQQVKKELRRNLVRGAIEWLLEAHAESHGQIEFLPKWDPTERENGRDDEPVVVALREFDVGSEEGIDELCDMFLEPPRRNWRDQFSRPKKRLPDASDSWLAAPLRRETVSVGRNQLCPCGSGHKYKKCCGR